MESVPRDPKNAGEYQNVGAAFTSATFVYAFSLTNVFMFSPQLKCFFMIAASLGSRMPQLIQEETSEVPVPAEAELPEEPLVEASPIDPARAHE